MKLSNDIDLGKSLRKLFGDDLESVKQVECDRARQVATVNAILKRFFSSNDNRRRELTLLADEVGLGKTYVALAAAVSILDAIRRGDAPEGLPVNKPVVLVLTPTNDALFNKWMREAEGFKTDCAKNAGGLDWLEIRSPIPGSSKSGNMADLAAQMRDASRSRPLLLIAKQSVLGATLNSKEWWRRRSLAVVFEEFNIRGKDRKWWCKRIIGTAAKSKVPELLDLRKSSRLWEDTGDTSSNLYRAYCRAVVKDKIQSRINNALTEWDSDKLLRALDDLTRLALSGDLPNIPLLIIDEIHNLKNEKVQARENLEFFLGGQISRFLGLSATPFQLRQNELLSILKLRNLLDIPSDRHQALDESINSLSGAMKLSKSCGDIFRRRWRALRPRDEPAISDSWTALLESPFEDRNNLAKQLRPPRLAHAFETALELEQHNTRLQKHLSSFVIRHQHPRGYREHFVGNRAEPGNTKGTFHFGWAPGLDVRGDDELVHYLMMRAVSLAKDEKGLPGLGAELTGSYRHLVETSAVWKKLAKSKNEVLREYRSLLEGMIGGRTEIRDPDSSHRKVKATAQRALEFFKKGQKSLIFCVYTKTAETVRDQVRSEIDNYLKQTRLRVFGDGTTFENFRKRFFNRREPLFSLIQDQPLLGSLPSGEFGIPNDLKLTIGDLNLVAEVLVEHGEIAIHKQPDRRLLLAATEHVALQKWNEFAKGERWIEKVFANCDSLFHHIVDPEWLVAREPLSRSKRAGRVRRELDPEAGGGSSDPLELELLDDERQSREENRPIENEINAWVHHLRHDTIGEVVAPYFQAGVIENQSSRLPLLVEHHHDLMAKFDLETRAVAGQVFRRTLMAEEFLLRYLADIERDNSTQWSDFLAKRYVQPLDGHFETLKDRVHAYLETLARAGTNKALLSGYHAAASNQNVVQLVKGGMDRDRYFLGFNTPYRPEVLISTAVGQEGIDLHRECRHVIHHDLCWNPATIEQRTGRVDRIGSKVERERLGAKGNVDAPTLEIAVPYLAATYDERMFEELYRRAQLFEVTLGGEMRVESRISSDQAKTEKKNRTKAGIGTEDEDLGVEGETTGTVNLPKDMVERLRVDLSIWKPASS
ncbi:DEAD/DEAH box helicase [Mariniblastus sp.]|nr:DEAD/DEAH box helicase [Mariniblastus sp.]